MKVGQQNHDKRHSVKKYSVSDKKRPENNIQKEQNKKRRNFNSKKPVSIHSSQGLVDSTPKKYYNKSKANTENSRSKEYSEKVQKHSSNTKRDNKSNFSKNKDTDGNRKELPNNNYDK